LPHAADGLRDAARHVESAAADGQEARHLADIIRAEPSIDEESQRLLGFRINPVPPNSRYIRAGLRPGDLVTAINGTPLADQERQHSQEVLDSALASSNASVSLLRTGRHLDVSIDLGQ
jgi:general secretion pathway protein C